jgi:hypothetical protein
MERSAAATEPGLVRLSRVCEGRGAQGLHAGPTTSGLERMKQLERENRELRQGH